jgi:hypothetical protein
MVMTLVVKAALALTIAGLLFIGVGQQPPTAQAICFHSQAFVFETKRYYNVDHSRAAECHFYSDPDTVNREVWRAAH